MLNTASMFISFYGRLEDKAAEFYEEMANNEKYSEGRETFRAFARESKRQKEMVLRTYREGITDAFEGGFPLADLRESDYEINTELRPNTSFSDALKMALSIEEKSRKFCADASEGTRALAGISRAFESVARQKAERKQKLETLSCRKK